MVKLSFDAAKVETNGETSQQQRAPQDSENRHPTHKNLTHNFVQSWMEESASRKASLKEGSEFQDRRV